MKVECIRCHSSMSSSELFSGGSESEPEDDIILQTSGDSAGSESESESRRGTGREVDWSCKDMSNFFAKRRKTTSDNVNRLAGKEFRREPAEANSTPVRFRGKASSNSGSRVLKEDEIQHNGQMRNSPTTPRSRTYKENEHLSSCSDREIPIDGVEVKSALQEITSLLNTVVKRVERVENELQRHHSLTPSSSSDATPGKAKPHVPLVLRVN